MTNPTPHAPAADPVCVCGHPVTIHAVGGGTRPCLFPEADTWHLCDCKNYTPAPSPARASETGAEGELERVINVAGEALGTDPSLRNAACVDALANWAKQLQAANAQLATRADAWAGACAERDALREALESLVESVTNEEIGFGLKDSATWFQVICKFCFKSTTKKLPHEAKHYKDCPLGDATAALAATAPDAGTGSEGRK